MFKRVLVTFLFLVSLTATAFAGFNRVDADNVLSKVYPLLKDGKFLYYKDDKVLYNFIVTKQSFRNYDYVTVLRIETDGRGGRGLDYNQLFNVRGYYTYNGVAFIYKIPHKKKGERQLIKVIDLYSLKDWFEYFGITKEKHYIGLFETVDTLYFNLEQKNVDLKLKISMSRTEKFYVFDVYLKIDGHYIFVTKMFL